MAPSTTSTSISTFLMSHGTLLVLEPLRQTNADLKSANEVLVLTHEMISAYCFPFFRAISCAKATMIHQALISHSASCGEDQRRKCSMLDVQDSLLVETLFLVLIDTINLL